MRFFFKGQRNNVARYEETWGYSVCQRRHKEKLGFALRAEKNQ
jgi:hypothetical protein